jgi:signal transduction histidine kinase
VDALRAGETRDAASLESLFAAVADGLIEVDADARIVRMNEAAEALHPYDEHERRLSFAERLRLGRYRKPDGRPFVPEETPLGRALRGERVLGQLMQLVYAGHPNRWLSSSAAPIRGPDGTITGAVATQSDVTALVELRERVEDLNRALTHDLRTPLAAVLLQAQSLPHAPPEEVPRRAKAIATGARRMATILESLADLVRVESDQLALDLRPLALRPFWDELCERLAGVLELDRVVVAFPADLPPLRADPDRLERILVNLLGNALKYSPADRPVRFAAAPVPAGIELSIEDRGAGIAPEDLPRIFDRFFRAGPAAGTPGLGLGLYITRQLVEAHGGTLAADSTVGEGSRFRVVLPAAPRAR